MREFIETNFRDTRKYISGVIKQCADNTANRQPLQRYAVFDVSNRHNVSTFHVRERRRPRRIQTESPQRGRSACPVSLSCRQLLLLTWRELGRWPVRMIPAETE